MADVLKGTIWWASNPVWTLTDNNATGSFEDSTLTAAGAHDANDGTREGLQSIGDGASLEGSASIETDRVLTSPPAGGIKFVRIKFRARATLQVGSGTISGTAQPKINGLTRGSQQLLTTSYVNYQQDFAVDPMDGLAWTPAKISAQTWGVKLTGQTNDPGTWLTRALTEMSEYTVEVWGQDVTGTPTGASSTGAVAQPVESGGGMAGVLALRDPTAIIAQATSIDTGSNLVTVRSADSVLNDQSNLTKRTNSGTNGSGTFTRDLGGTQGSTSINGSGTITGVAVVLVVRASKSNTATLGTFRVGTAMGLKTLVADPTIFDFDAGLNDTMWRRVETALITLGAFGNPFVWGTGVDSVWANFVAPTWDFRAAWTAAVGKTAQVEVAEAWLEVHGPSGSQPILIELTHAINLAPKIQTLEGSF